MSSNSIGSYVYIIDWLIGKKILLCPNDPLCVLFRIIFAKYFCKPKIWNFWVHFMVQENVACFEISMDDTQPRVFMQIQKSLCYPIYYYLAFVPIYQSSSGFICESLNIDILKKKKLFPVSFNKRDFVLQWSEKYYQKWRSPSFYLANIHISVVSPVPGSSILRA